MAIYGYIRVSTDDQALGLEAQRSAILAKHPDATIEADEGVGGADPERPAFARILEQLKKGDTVVMVRRDRLVRGDPLLAAMFDREVTKRGARMVTLEGAVMDANDPSAVLFCRILDAMSEFERAMIRARTRAALKAKKAKGLRIGAVPFGYDLGVDGQLVTNAAEQGAIATARRMRKRGKSLREIAAALDGKGIRNKAGRPLAAQSVKQMLAAA
jgi:DNA invertase Pin-like site-specific DNA recombinase